MAEDITTNQSALRLDDHWKLMRDVMSGEDCIKSEVTSGTYLRKPKNKTKEEYDAYVSRGRFPDAISRTIRSYRAKAFSEGVTYTDVFKKDGPARLTTSVQKTAEWVFNEAAVIGFGGVVIDMPEDGIRFVRIKAEDILDWGFDEDETLMFVKYRAKSSTFTEGHRAVELSTYHLFLDSQGEYKVNAYVLNEESGEWDMTSSVNPSVGGKNLTYIPFAFIGSVEPQIPMFYGMAKLCLRFLDVSASRAQSLYLSAHATPYLIDGDDTYGVDNSEFENAYPQSYGSSGVNNNFDAPGSRMDTVRPAVKHTKIEFGSNRFLQLPKGSQIGFLEIAGTALAPLREELDDLRMEIASLGARAMLAQSSSQVTAKTELLQQDQDLSLLSGVIKTTDTVMTNLLKMSADMLGYKGEVKFDIGGSLYKVTFSPSELMQLVHVWEAGGISRKELNDQFRRGGVFRGKTDEEISDELEEDEAKRAGISFDAE